MGHGAAVTAWSDRIGRLAHGGDYNPEQWPEEVWEQDVALMREAGVTMVTLGVFSWALLEPDRGRYDFGWLDRVVDLVAGAGIAVDLATATASPPPWLTTAHPEVLPVTADGTRLWPGSRQAYCPSSPVFREHAAGLAAAMAHRYGEHPALAMWHVSNELGCHNARCYCDVSAAAFRTWLQARYGDLDELNRAWGTAFWSQRYSAWEQVLPPRVAPAFPNPTQQLDFRRFSSDEVLACYTTERDVLRAITPDVPITTNLMVTDHVDGMDYWRWAPELDFVANDHYPVAASTEKHVELALRADTTRGLAGGKPWLLMEHSPSAVNWQPRNVALQPGELLRHSLSHVARGSDGAMFFQWRASRAGAEKFHAGMVPHAGTDTKTFRDVTALGAALAALGEVRGSTVHADVALVYDWQAWWASGLDSHPSVDVDYQEQVGQLHAALWRAGVTVDVVAPGAPVDGYRVVVVPTLYLVTDEAAAVLARYAEGGGTLVVTYFSGIVDEHDHIRLGGYPGAFREVLGVRTEEFFPLRAGESTRLDDGSTATVWTELVHLDGAEAVRRHADGPVAGHPAVTRREVGAGRAWYLATRLDDEALQGLVDQVLVGAGVSPVVQPQPGLEAVRRRAEDGTGYLFLINHAGEDRRVEVTGRVLVGGGGEVDGAVDVPAGAVVVVREPAAG